MSDTPAVQPRRAAVIFIFITLLLDVLALGIIIPVLPDLVKGFLNGDTSRSAEMLGYFGTTWAAMQFVCSPIIGALSDRFGRRRIVLMSNLGLGLDYLLMALAPSLPWLFVGRVVSGITSASFSTASAYIADVTPPEKRAGAFGMVGAAFGAGFVFGPALGGVLGHIDLRLPFWVAGGLSLANFTYGLVVLPESLPPERRQPFSWKRANPVGSLALLSGRPGLLGLAGVAFLYQLAHQVLQSVFVLYAGYRYHWNPQQVGYTMAVVGVSSMVVQGGLVRPVVKRFGERGPLVVGLLFGAAGFLIFGLAATGPLFLVGIPVMGLMGFTGPSMQGLMSRRIGPTMQGQLQGALSSLMGIAGMVGPWLFTQTFAQSIAPDAAWQYPGAVFVLATGLLVVAAMIAVPASRPQPTEASVSPSATIAAPPA